MLTHAKIHKIFTQMQQRNGIIPDAYPEYCIELSKKHMIKLYGHSRSIFSVPTTQLSDIHAILQLCHPNTPYCIYYDINTSEKHPDISIYSHQHAPNILTTELPAKEYEKNYTIEPANISQVIIQPNEPIITAIRDIRKHIKQSFAFIDQYPHIEIGYQCVNSTQKIPHLNNTHVKMSLYKHYPSNIKFHLSIHDQYKSIHIKEFFISTEHLTELGDRCVAHIHHIAPKLMQDIQYYFAGSQHEKIHIIRQIISYLTHTNNELFTCIQDCVHILMNHYTCDPSISHP